MRNPGGEGDRGRMNRAHPVQIERRTIPRKCTGQCGIASGCLIAMILVVVILVGAGIYVARNYRSWAARAAAFAMTAAINESGLPAGEKAEINAILEAVKENYIAGEIQLNELGAVLEAMADCPALATGMVVQFEASYVTPSGLSAEEKAAARLHLNRFAQGLINESVGWDQLDDVTAPILIPKGEGKSELKPPQQCSVDEIRQVLVNVKSAADRRNIPMQFVHIDISDEFLRTIETALGRTLD